MGTIPFTPFHWGLSLLIQAIAITLDPLSLFAGSVIIDLEGVYSLILPDSGVLIHGYLHSLVGAFILGLIVGISSFFINKLIHRIDFRIDNPTPFTLPKYSLKICLVSAFIGTYSHILLDAFLYTDLQLNYLLPIENPLLNLLSWEVVYFLCIVCFIIGAVILVGRYRAYLTDDELV
ncbi:MAG: hypothetical protein ACW98I_13315 [Candidatus Hodarchaeales archaeon]